MRGNLSQLLGCCVCVCMCVIECVQFHRRQRKCYELNFSLNLEILKEKKSSRKWKKKIFGQIYAVYSLNLQLICNNYTD